jgi:hypothetical protein
MPPEVVQRFFPGARLIEGSSDPVFATPEMQELKERDRVLWLEHDRARLAYEDAAVHVEDIKRGRAAAGGRDADSAVGARFDRDIAAAVERREELRDGCSAILQEINRLSLKRKALHRPRSPGR